MLKYVHYLYFSVLLSFITLVVVVGVSLATEEPTPEQVKQRSPLSPVGSISLNSQGLQLQPLSVTRGQ